MKDAEDVDGPAVARAAEEVSDPKGTAMGMEDGESSCAFGGIKSAAGEVEAVSPRTSRT